MNIIEDLKWRYATKEFDRSKKVPKEDLDGILDALVLTPSSFGLQAWKFVVIENQEVKDQLLEHSWNQRQVVDASQVIVLCRPTDFGPQYVDKLIDATAITRGQSVEGLEGYSKVIKGFLSRKDSDSLENWIKCQVYIALGNIMTVCAGLRIDTCPMEGFEGEAYDNILGLKDKNLASVVALTIGYRTETDKYASARKVRYHRDDMVIRI